MNGITDRFKQSTHHSPKIFISSTIRAFFLSDNQYSHLQESVCLHWWNQGRLSSEDISVPGGQTKTQLRSDGKRQQPIATNIFYTDDPHPSQYSSRNLMKVSRQCDRSEEHQTRYTRRFHKHEAVKVEFPESLFRIRSIRPVLSSVIRIRLRFLDRRFSK